MVKTPPNDETQPIIGVIGGSGLYSLLEPGSGGRRQMATPYGPTSADLTVGTLGERTVAFLPRHGDQHTLSPGRVPYRANIWALASLGVRAIVTSSAVGSVSPSVMPGEFVVPDQLIDQTWGRLDTFYDSDDVQHLSFSDPYCPRLRASALAALDGLGEHFHPTGTTVVIPGPRFSTRAESRRFREEGAHLVNMTQYPEAALAAELNIGLVNLSFVTDLDAGDTIDEAVDPAIVLRRMAAAAPRLRAAVAAIVAAVPADYASRELVPRESVLAVLAARPAGS